MFDCVLPTRLARHGTVLTDEGKFNLRRAEFARQRPAAGCLLAREPGQSLVRGGYLRHLLVAKEPTAPRILTLHNLAWLLRFMEQMSDAIKVKQFEMFRGRVHDVWGR